MTYAEVAQALGLPSARAALQRSRRGQWPRRQHNDNKLVRVGVPASVLAASRDPSRPPATSLTKAGSSNTSRVTGGVTPGSVPEPQALGALADVLRQERERREAAEADAARAKGEVDGLREALRRADLAAEEAGRREATAMHGFEQARGRAQRAETAAAAHRDAEARATAQAAAERAARQAAEAAWQAAEAEADSARAELADFTSGGPFRRALRAFAFRRSRL
jgi:hypothetical protein